MQSDSRRRLLYAVVTFVACAASQLAGAQTTYWVDDGGNDSNDGLSDQTPWKHISFAVFQVSSGDTIKILPGTYNVSGNQEVFPIPVPSGVIIMGSASAEASWPRLAGDANNTSTTSILKIDATSSDVTGVGLERLYFVGENTATKDAPAAIEVLVSGVHQVTDSGVTNCKIERSAMNATGAAGKPSILIRVGEGNGTTDFSIRDTTIYPTRRGGVEVTFESTADYAANAVVTVEDCEFRLSGTDDADFGVFFGGGTSTTAGGGIRLIQTTIDSRDCTTPSDGIVTGLDIWVNSTDDATVFFQDCQVVGNLIAGCSGDGVRIRTDIEGDLGQAEILFTEADEQFFRNTIICNAGAGVHLDWNDVSGYILFSGVNNLIAENYYGYWYEDFTEDASGVNVLRSDTIAYNTSVGIRLDGDFDAGGVPGPNLRNLIVWGNNSGGAQVAGSGQGASWNPVNQGGLNYSCWQGLSGNPLQNHNINSNPEFVDQVNGNYDLDGGGSPASPCVDKGYTYASLPRTDIHGEDRTVNGDGQGGAEVDMGCDEYDP